MEGKVATSPTFCSTPVLGDSSSPSTAPTLVASSPFCSPPPPLPRRFVLRRCPPPLRCLPLRLQCHLQIRHDRDIDSHRNRLPYLLKQTKSESCNKSISGSANKRATKWRQHPSKKQRSTHLLISCTRNSMAARRRRQLPPSPGLQLPNDTRRRSSGLPSIRFCCHHYTESQFPGPRIRRGRGF